MIRRPPVGTLSGPWLRLRRRRDRPLQTVLPARVSVEPSGTYESVPFWHSLLPVMTGVDGPDDLDACGVILDGVAVDRRGCADFCTNESRR